MHASRPTSVRHVARAALITPAGRAATKLAAASLVVAGLSVLPSQLAAASEQGSGLSFTGHAKTRDTYVVLKAEGTASSLKLRNEDARERVITP